MNANALVQFSGEFITCQGAPVWPAAQVGRALVSKIRIGRVLRCLGWGLHRHGILGRRWMAPPSQLLLPN